MFIDASVIVAILTKEPEADRFADQIEAVDSSITSPIAVFEAVAAISRKRRVDIEQARELVYEFLETAGITIAPITSKDADAALAAYSRYGKGRGHPAQLNLGDCFAYAAATIHRRELLFKGDDFGQTDIRRASRAR